MLGKLDGELLEGTVEAVEGDFVKMTLNTQSLEDVADITEGRPIPAVFCILGEFEQTPAAGSTATVFVDGADKDDRLMVSKRRAEDIRLYAHLESCFTNQTRLKGTVTAVVKGGFSLDIGVRAFLPASQTSNIDDPKTLVGQELEAEILKFQAHRGNIVLSRKSIVAEERRKNKEALLKRLSEGDIITGRIRRFSEFGAFVDIGGVDGLLHNSDMSWGRVQHGTEVFQKGQEVRVKILKLERGGDRIALGHKQTTEDPWVSVAQRYEEGKTIEGTVMSLATYGAFISLEPGIEGLVHVSELSWNPGIKRAADVLKVGDTVQTMVLGVDTKERRISLGIRQLQDNPWEAFAAAHPVGSRAKGPVVGLTDFGIFVRLANGIDGLVHISDMSWTKSINEPADLYKITDEVEVIVLRIDADQQRLSLGVKQLLEDPWQAFMKAFPKGSKISGQVVKAMEKAAELKLDSGIAELPEITGICRISEMATDRIERVDEAMKVGATLEVAVLGVDRRRQRVDVSLKALLLGDVDYKKYMASSGFSNTLGDALKDFSNEN